MTIQQLIKNLSEFDDDLVIEFNPIELEDSELTINEIILDDEDEEGKIKISFDYDLETFLKLYLLSSETCFHPHVPSSYPL